MSRPFPLALAASLFAVIPVGAGPAAQSDGAAAVPVTWRGDDLSLAELEKRAPQAAAVVAAWQPFAAASDHRLVLGDAGQVLMVLRPQHSRPSARSERPLVKKFLKTLAAVVTEVQRQLGEPKADAAPVVVIATTETAYPKALDHIAVIDPRLQAWAQGGARKVTGFVLSEPLAAAWLDDARGQEEWDPQNELAHRAAQLLLRREAPQQPAWFALGFGWHVEEAVCGSIFCYPQRAGFVWAVEHTGQAKRLRVAFKESRRKQAGLPAELTMDEIASWEPSAADEEFDAGKADLAFGLVRILSGRGEGALLEVAQGFDAAIQEGWIVKISATQWTTDPQFRLSAAAQLAVLQAVDRDFLADATEALSKGKLPSSPRSH